MSQSPPCCIVDGLQASEAVLTLLDGAWYCAAHAQCATCGQPFSENLGSPRFIPCVCADYGWCGHEEQAWCSMDCLELAHLEPPDRDPNPEEDTT